MPRYLVFLIGVAVVVLALLLLLQALMAPECLEDFVQAEVGDDRCQ